MRDTITGLIPARGGSLRVPHKNIRYLHGHPLIAYSIQSAMDAGIFSNIVVATDSDEIAKISRYYGINDVFMRSPENATSTSLDIDWLTICQESGLIQTRNFAILRPTSPFRSSELIRKVKAVFDDSTADSIRTIARVKEHPGKMWRVNVATSEMEPYIEQTPLEVASHAKQYQSLEALFVQTSVLEMAKTSVISEYGTREGVVVAPYITEGSDSHAIDTELDWQMARMLIEMNPDLLPKISARPFPGETN